MMSEKNMEEERDILSDMPEYVLLHIMKFMHTKDVVRTCVLSKRWNNLWKRTTTLSFMRKHFTCNDNYNEFVSRVLSGRDASISLFDLHFGAHGSDPTLLNKVIQYAVLHNVEHMTITTSFDFTIIPNSFFPLIFSSHSLTFLKLSSGPTLELPKSLVLPTLKCLHLTNVSFTSFENECAEPFSCCDMLNALVLQDYSLRNDAKVLSISNSKLSCLKVDNTPRRVKGYTIPHKIVLSTPNLTSITIVIFTRLQVSSACNLSFLEEVNIDTHVDCSVIMNWLQVLSNVKKLTLSTRTLARMHEDLSSQMKIQPPWFVRLESFKIKNDPSSKISNEQVHRMEKRVAEYLLQNSPISIVPILRNLLPYSMHDYLGKYFIQ
uniref:F-box/FBD/LRR-repeat protein At1g66290 family n=1 Tax=Cajanus cajan TaxID=3821 RepID=A0A151T3F3_CAJCA|nr:Putative F-box/FBD/LRR-repeat protein At1g66290 family [Cajanus cajan]